MVRPLRLDYEGALHHVTSRGNARAKIFLDERDRAKFLDVLADATQRFGWICHAYCLMHNHYHLLLETPAAGLSRGMQLLNGTYTQWFNWRHRRCGHLLQGRFKAILVEKDSYLLELTRYIVLNPVRGKLVGRVGDWPWSSYLPTCGQAAIPPFLTVDWILSQFDADRERAISIYKAFVQEGLGVDVWRELRGGWILGSQRFAEDIVPRLKSVPEDPEIRRREIHAMRPSLTELFDGVTEVEKRNERVFEAVHVHRYTLREVTDHIGLARSTVCGIAKRQKHRKAATAGSLADSGEVR